MNSVESKTISDARWPVDTLIIVSHKRHAVSSDGCVRVEGGFMAITNEIARHFARVCLCVPCVRTEETTGVRYRENVELVALPAYKNRLELLLLIPRIARAIRRQVVVGHSVVYAMGPNDVGVVGMLVARYHGLPFFASLDTDRAQKVVTRDYGVLVRFVKRYANELLLYPLIQFLCKDVPVFVTGNMFLRGSKYWRQWVKTTVRRDDILVKQPARVISDDDTPTVIFVGRLSSEKNVDTLLSAMAELNRRRRRSKLLIVGDGEERERLQDQAINLDLSNVTFVGRMANTDILASRFLAADVLVLPSKEERQGKVLLEAMACSVPVVAARAGGIPSVIEHGENGLLFDPSSATELADLLESLLFGSAATRDALIDAGWIFARAHALDAEVVRLVQEVRAWWDAGYGRANHA